MEGNDGGDVIDARARFAARADRSMAELFRRDPAQFWAEFDPDGSQRAMWRAAGAVVHE